MAIQVGGRLPNVKLQTIRDGKFESVQTEDFFRGKKVVNALIDLPFAASKRFRLQVNGRWAKKLPVANKTAVMRQLRTWWVAH